MMAHDDDADTTVCPDCCSLVKVMMLMTMAVVLAVMAMTQNDES